MITMVATRGLGSMPHAGTEADRNWCATSTTQAPKSLKSAVKVVAIRAQLGLTCCLTTKWQQMLMMQQPKLLRLYELYAK